MLALSAQPHAYANLWEQGLLLEDGPIAVAASPAIGYMHVVQCLCFKSIIVDIVASPPK